MAGRIKAERLSSGSTNRGRPDWPKSPCGGARKKTPMRWAALRCCRCSPTQCSKRLPRKGWRRISRIGWRIRISMSTGSRFPSRITTRRSRFRSSTWARGTTSSWLAREKNTKYYLHSAGAANGLSGGGVLNTVAPAEEKPDQYVNDPGDATPTIGGPLCCGALPTGIGPQDQRPAEARGDVLVYTTPAFMKDTEVTGPVSLDLYVSSSPVGTDFTGMLLDGLPNGFSPN